MGLISGQSACARLQFNELTSLAVTLSVTRGRAKMQKMVTPSLTAEYELWKQMATLW